jgi:hypothetical protein
VCASKLAKLSTSDGNSLTGGGDRIVFVGIGNGLRVKGLKGHVHMAHYDQDVLKRQFPIVKFFIYHLIYARIIRESYPINKLFIATKR